MHFRGAPARVKDCYVMLWKLHFRGSNFKNFPVEHASRPPSYARSFIISDTVRNWPRSAPEFIYY